MSIVARSIVDASQRAVNYGEALLKGITPAMFARFPSPGGTPIVTNHPAFVYGHLCLYPAKFLENAGRDFKPLLMPQRYTDTCAAGVECKDDPTGTIFPPMEEIIANFKRVHAEAFKIIAEMTDEEFARPPALERSRGFMPTMGGLTTFYFMGHTMMHLGQVSAWRRCMGLGSAM
jgi:hypothetical protein